jgi:hypothetical protein
MNFSHRKLPTEAASTLRICPIDSVKPFALMLAPVYVYMKLNQKFVAVKAPLDFFTPEELQKIRPFESLYVTPFVDEALPFRDAARRVRALLNFADVGPVAKKSGSEPYPDPCLGPAPFEVSDGVLQIIGKLWSDGLVIEPFFLAVFANELCELLPSSTLLSAREKDVQRFERAVMQSSWAVFIALHLGYCNMSYLNRLRDRVFREILDSQSSSPQWSETDDLVRASSVAFQEAETRSVTGEHFASRDERVFQKMASRLERVKAELMNKDAPAPSIYGPKGFVDV